MSKKKTTRFIPSQSLLSDWKLCIDYLRQKNLHAFLIFALKIKNEITTLTLSLNNVHADNNTLEKNHQYFKNVHPNFLTTLSPDTTIFYYQLIVWFINTRQEKIQTLMLSAENKIGIYEIMYTTKLFHFAKFLLNLIYVQEQEMKIPQQNQEKFAKDYAPILDRFINLQINLTEVLISYALLNDYILQTERMLQRYEEKYERSWFKCLNKDLLAKQSFFAVFLNSLKNIKKRSEKHSDQKLDQKRSDLSHYHSYKVLELLNDAQHHTDVTRHRHFLTKNIFSLFHSYIPHSAKFIRKFHTAIEIEEGRKFHATIFTGSPNATMTQNACNPECKI